jgi:hypothetical protein
VWDEHRGLNSMPVTIVPATPRSQRSDQQGPAARARFAGLFWLCSTVVNMFQVAPLDRAAAGMDCLANAQSALVPLRDRRARLRRGRGERVYQGEDGVDVSLHVEPGFPCLL